MRKLSTLTFICTGTFLSTLFTNTHNLNSVFKVRCRISHPHKTSGKITVLLPYIVIFSVQESRWVSSNFVTEQQHTFRMYSSLNFIMKCIYSYYCSDTSYVCITSLIYKDTAQELKGQSIRGPRADSKNK